jgi:hypothetical protein
MTVVKPLHVLPEQRHDHALNPRQMLEVFRANHRLVANERIKPPAHQSLRRVRGYDEVPIPLRGFEFEKFVVDAAPVEEVEVFFFG